jgi:hypothetical protein
MLAIVIHSFQLDDDINICNAIIFVKKTAKLPGQLHEPFSRMLHSLSIGNAVNHPVCSFLGEFCVKS